MEVSSTVDLESISFDSEGFSGADLQAMMYNAHLEVIHAQIDNVSADKGKSNGTEEKSKSKNKGKGKGKAVEEDNEGHQFEKVEEKESSVVGYKAIPEQTGSRAEKAAFHARVCLLLFTFDES